MIYINICRFNRAASGLLPRLVKRSKVVTRLLLGLTLLVAQPLMAEESNYTLFESGQVRPLEMSPNGKWLFAVNTPASRLEVFKVGREGQLTMHTSVPVGVDPVAVAARNNKEVWVVNHVSDSVSIVDYRKGVWGVANTLLVGDEPRDIVFAKTKGVTKKAYITTAHRGQNVPYDPQLTTPGVDRADVWIFDAQGAKNSPELGGKPLKIMTFFTDTPRALAVSKDGKKVYVAGFLTGNQTTVIPEQVVTESKGLPGPVTNFEGFEQPKTSLIVRHNGTHWVDELGRDWSSSVKFNLPDKDVFVIDASTNDPVADSAQPFYRGVGTVLFNMAVHPRSGEIYVSNTEANNSERFEGPGDFAGHTIRGNVVQNRISILSNDGLVTTRDLNKHIDRSKCCETVPNETNAKSLAFPTGMVFSKNGKTLYVAALGSKKIGVFNSNELKTDKFKPDVADQIILEGGGPTGLVLNNRHRKLYVMTRFNNAIAVVDTKKKEQIDSIALYNPEPEYVVKGRRFLYDASFTSSAGDVACASCHIFGDNDGLAWDLGNPDGVEKNHPGPFKLTPDMFGIEMNMNLRPMKGPMVTQSFRGMDNHGPMHWRGDRTAGNDEPTIQPNGGTFNERAAFGQFNEAFVGLHGRDSELSEDDIELFTDFVLDITYPPNPIRALDNSLTAEQQAGRDFYFNRESAPPHTCNGCHTLDADANKEHGVKHPGFYGTDGSATFEFEEQSMKVPHFRNLYARVGMFGMSAIQKLRPDLEDGTNVNTGDQIRGFGYQHDGAIDTVERFSSSILFSFLPPGPNSPGSPEGFSADPVIGMKERREVESFILAYDSNMAPIVGQQVTLTRKNSVVSLPRVKLMIARDAVNECDLIATTDRNRGYRYAQGKGFVAVDSEYAKITTLQKLLNKVSKNKARVTFTCTPPGGGLWMADI